MSVSTQAYVQTNDDNLERDVQTEEIEMTNRWTQHPPEGRHGCGTADENKDTKSDVSTAQDDGKLSSFLQRTCQVSA